MNPIASWQQPHCRGNSSGWGKRERASESVPAGPAPRPGRQSLVAVSIAGLHRRQPAAVESKMSTCPAGDSHCLHACSFVVPSKSSRHSSSSGVSAELRHTVPGQTACCSCAAAMLQGLTHYADWSSGGWHPKTYTAQDITPGMVQRMRSGQQDRQHSAAAATASTTAAAAIAASGYNNLEYKTGMLSGSVASSSNNASSSSADRGSGGFSTVQSSRNASGGVLESGAAAGGGSLPGKSNRMSITAKQLAARPPAPCHSSAAIWSAATHIFKPLDASPSGADGVAQTAWSVDADGAGRQSSTLANSALGRHAPAWRATIGSRAASGDKAAAAIAGTAFQHEGGQTLAADTQRMPGQVGRSGGATDSSPATSGLLSGWIVAAGYVPLGVNCPMFARKFPAAAVNQTLALALSCSGLGLGSWCGSAGHGMAMRID